MTQDDWGILGRWPKGWFIQKMLDLLPPVFFEKERHGKTEESFFYLEVYEYFRSIIESDEKKFLDIIEKRIELNKAKSASESK